MIRNYDGESISANKGKLSFEKDGIRFRGKGVQAQEIYILYREIDLVQPYNTLGLIPNGMLVHMVNGVEYRFTVKERQGVIEFIQGKAESAKHTEEVCGDENAEEVCECRQDLSYSELARIEQKERCAEKENRRKILVGIAAVAGLLVAVVLCFSCYELFIYGIAGKPHLTWDGEYQESSFTQEEINSETMQWFCAACELYFATYYQYEPGWILVSQVGDEQNEYMQGYLAEDMAGNGWTITSREEAIAVVEDLVENGESKLYEEKLKELEERDLLDLSEEEFTEYMYTELTYEDYELIMAYAVHTVMPREDGLKTWDYTRAMQVLAEAYVAGYISLEECLDNSLVIAKQLQKTSESWEDLYGNYLVGAKFREIHMEQDYVMTDTFYDVGERDRTEWPHTVDYNTKLVDTWSNF